MRNEMGWAFWEFQKVVQGGLGATARRTGPPVPRPGHGMLWMRSDNVESRANL